MPIENETDLPRHIPENRDRLTIFRRYLNPHGCSVRKALITNQFYLTDKSRRTYMLRLTKWAVWVCEPLGHKDLYEAEQLLQIAMGKRQREID